VARLPFLPLRMPNSLPSVDSCIFPTHAWIWEVFVGLGIVLGYMGLLYFGAIIVPGVGLAGHLMVQVPSSLLEWAHAPGYGILAVLVTLGINGTDGDSGAEEIGPTITTTGDQGSATLVAYPTSGSTGGRFNLSTGPGIKIIVRVTPATRGSGSATARCRASPASALAPR